MDARHIAQRHANAPSGQLSRHDVLTDECLIPLAPRDVFRTQEGKAPPPKQSQLDFFSGRVVISHQQFWATFADLNELRGKCDGNPVNHIFDRDFRDSDHGTRESERDLLR